MVIIDALIALLTAALRFALLLASTGALITALIWLARLIRAIFGVSALVAIALRRTALRSALVVLILGSHLELHQ